MILPSWSLRHLSQDEATVLRHAPGEGAADGGTVIELAHRWVASRVKSGDLTKGSAAVVRCNLRSFVNWLPPAVERPEQLTRRHVERWLESMDGLSPSTRAGRLSAVRGGCEWLVIERRRWEWQRSAHPCTSDGTIAPVRVVLRVQFSFHSFLVTRKNLPSFLYLI
jgi:hypothetical protein